MSNITDCHFSKTTLAKYLGKSVRWVDYLVSGPNPPPRYKINKSWIFKKTEIDAWLRQFRVTDNLDNLVEKTPQQLSGSDTLSRFADEVKGEVLEK